MTNPSHDCHTPANIIAPGMSRTLQRVGSMPLFGTEPGMRDRLGDCSASFCCNQRLINVSTCTPRNRAYCFMADSRSNSMGTAQAI